jgi:hypothetical protein
MDTKLCWDYHCERVEVEVTKRIAALLALASSTWGTGMINLRQVYRAMIVPQMLYGCSAWHIPGMAYGLWQQGNGKPHQENTKASSAGHHWSLPDNGRSSYRC